MEGKKKGQGKLEFNDGDLYEGEFDDNLFNGVGKLYKAEDNSLYEGQFVNDVAHGKGVLTNDDGTTYEGQFK